MSTDPHEPYVAELKAKNDWAGLLRYGMAHHLYMPAVDAAIEVLHSRHFGANYATLRTWLTEFRENPMKPRKPFEQGSLKLDEDQYAALILVETLPLVTLCETAGNFPPEMQTQMFQQGELMAGLWLGVATQRDDNALLAASHGNLAQSYFGLRQFENAVASYEAALVEFRQLAAQRPDVYQSVTAGTLNNLGGTQIKLTRFEDAVASFEEVLLIQCELAVTRPEFYPAVAQTLNSLGAARSHLTQFEDAVANFEGAMLFRRKLAAAQPYLYLPDVAQTLNNLGIAQRHLTRFMDAIASFEEALLIQRKLDAAQPDVYKPDLATTLNNLGNVQSSLAQFKEAVASFEEAIRIYDKLEEHFGSAQLVERISAYRNNANLILRECPDLGWPDFCRARQLLQSASRLASGFRNQFADPRERIRVQHAQLGLYAQRVKVCLKYAELYNDATAYDEALEAAEAGRSRALLDALAQKLLPEEAPLELKQKFQSLQRHLRRAQRRLHQELETKEALVRANSLDNQMETDTQDETKSLTDCPVSDGNLESANRVSLATARHVSDTLTLSQSLAEQSDYMKRIDLIFKDIQGQAEPFRDLVNQLRTFDPEFQPDAAVDSFRMHDRASLFPSAKRTVYVHLQPSVGQYMAMILTQDRLIPVMIPQWTSEVVNQMTQALVSCQFQNSSKSMTTALNLLLPQILTDLQSGLQTLLLLSLADSGLQPGDRLVLVPDPLLSLLPLHAVLANASQSLCELYEVAYSPSLSVLQQCIKRERPAPTHLFGVVDPTNTLAGPMLESALAERHFSKSNIVTKCDHLSLYSKACEAHVFYWMGHAQFSFQVPYWSGLLLKQSGSRQITNSQGRQETRSFAVAPTDLATFTDIDCGLTVDQCSLAILSGCQSGLALSGKGNESVSLVSAFLNAGAKCVIASLWPVDDRACLLTMHRFMLAWREEGMGIAASLRTAQQWLRTLSAHDLKIWAESCPELQSCDWEEYRSAFTSSAIAMINSHGSDYRPFESPFYWAAFFVSGHAWDDMVG